MDKPLAPPPPPPPPPPTLASTARWALLLVVGLPVSCAALLACSAGSLAFDAAGPLEAASAAALAVLAATAGRADGWDAAAVGAAATVLS